MLRISLALALAGVVAVTGCGQSGSDVGSGGNEGIKEGTFTVVVQNGQAIGTSTANPTLAIKGGYITSNPVGINCGSGTGHTACTADFATGSTVVLTAAPDSGKALLVWGGDCQGNAACSLSGAADKYVVAVFGAPGTFPHPNWSDPVDHGAAYTAYMAGTGAYVCKDCHGATLAGQGIAVSCQTCHFAKAPATAMQERCVSCHPTAGTEHQAQYNNFADGINPATTKFAVSNVSLAITDSGTAGKKKATVTFTLTKGGAPFTAAPSTLKQKTVYFVTYDSTAKKFPTPAYNQTADVDASGEIGLQDAGSVVNFGLGTMTATGTPGVFTMVKDLLNSDPVAAATNAFLYGYFGDAVIPALEGNLNPGGRHYALMDNMVSFAVVLKGTVDYTSTAKASGCEKCHGAPYSKHGYRQAAVAGLNDFVACKACHTDFRRGTDAGWYVLSNEPTTFFDPAYTLTQALKTKYAYVANVMQDTHNSHSFEFPYPQTISNCTTCHEGKLDAILTDANFVGTTCKSCHPTTNLLDSEGRAPSFAGPELGTALSHHSFNWEAKYDATTHALIAPAGTLKETAGGVDSYIACNECHADDIADGFAYGVHLDPADPKAHDGVGPKLFALPTPVPLFKDIHGGKVDSVYGADGKKYTDTIGTQLVSATRAGNKLTLTYRVTNITNSATLIKPTVVASLYGFGTKDFTVSGHGSASDGKRILEFTEGATNNQPTRLDVTPLMTAGNTNWTVVIDLTTWAANLADGSVKRIEVGFLPALGVDQTKAPDGAATVTSGTPAVTSPNPNYNPFIAIGGLATTLDVTGTTVAVVPDASSYGKSIVDAAKCNKCHEALAITFHTANYGSAGVVGCRLCHVVGSGGSHLEMQSRSIDSYVHSIHRFQYFDIKNVNFADNVAAGEYEEHINSVYPNFSIMNCESCHNAGTYDVPDQSKSLPGVHSASSTLTGKTRAITGVPSVVVGPGSRSCGGCHRAALINEDDAAGLARYDSHSGPEFGYRQTSLAASGTTPSTLDQIIAKLKGLFL